MMCLRTWENKTGADFDSLDQWCDFVNKNEQYAKEISATDFPCKPTELPSFHPYWVLKAGNERMEWYKKHLFNVVNSPSGLEAYRKSICATATIKSINNERKQLKKRLSQYKT